MPDLTTSKCRSCKAPIIWCVTVLGSRMPVDAQPCDDGNMVLRRRGDHILAIHLSKVKTTEHAKQNKYKSHYATCPHAKQWRRRN